MTLPVKTLPYAGICVSRSDCPTHVLQPQSHACHMMQSKMAFNAKRRRVVDVDKGIHESIRRLGYENVKDHQRKVTDIETYIQETGRGGRDGNTTIACLYYLRRDLSLQFMEPEILSYCKNVELCHRDVLFNNFDYCSKERPVGCSCCDLCLLVCDCDNCKV